MKGLILLWRSWFDRETGRVWTQARWSWVGHAAAAVLAPVPIAFFWPLGGFTYPALVSIVAWYYVMMREPKDERIKRSDGSWDKRESGGVTGLQDRFGDSIGPAAGAIAAWVSYLLSMAS